MITTEDVSPQQPTLVTTTAADALVAAIDAGCQPKAIREEPAVPASYMPLPTELSPRVQEQLRALYPEGLYRHQAEALEAWCRGEDVCLATETASGKSLVFMAAALDLLERDPQAKVLAFYPMKALVHDQRDKWRALLEPCGHEVTLIDGNVCLRERAELLQKGRVVLMTPDVAHAWMMSHLNEPEVREAVGLVKMLVLDEAHLYDGVFGSNMACFMRRLQVATGGLRLMTATATVAEPRELMRQLTGCEVTVIDESRSGAPRYKRVVCLVEGSDDAELLVRLLKAEVDPFLVFVDSRREVEQLTRQVRTRLGLDPEDETSGFMPYRSGYEGEDRAAIQDALASGGLRGVISTSALEVGVDIGRINVVVCLGRGHTVKSFRQRIGRAGRQGESCVLLVEREVACDEPREELKELLEARSETNRLYLENPYLLFAQVLCAHQELNDLGLMPDDVAAAYGSLPNRFMELLRGEYVGQVLDDELHELKSRVEMNRSPHYEYTLRSSTGVSYDLKQEGHGRFGSMTRQQLMREAYPGATYLHMGCSYEVRRVDGRRKTAYMRRSWARRRLTRPMLQSRVFPELRRGVLQQRSGPGLMVAESKLQVSERVVGFYMGSDEVRYEAGCRYAQRPIKRYLATTGVCWTSGGRRIARQVGYALRKTAVELLGIHVGDLGVGTFSMTSSGSREEGQLIGGCVYDAVDGSLRLTQALYERFDELVLATYERVWGEDECDQALCDALLDLLSGLERCVETVVDEMEHDELDFYEEDEFTEVVVASGSKAWKLLQSGERVEVTVEGVTCTLRGLMYAYSQDGADATCHAASHAIRPIPGVSLLEAFNTMTGERTRVGVA